jgi:hypothetical protein
MSVTPLEACRQFEHVLLSQILRASSFGKSTALPDDGDADDTIGAFSESRAGGDFANLLADVLADAVARAGGIGLAPRLAAIVAGASR